MRDGEARGVGGVDFDVEGRGGEFAEDVAFVGAAAGVPLRGAAAAGVEEERVGGAWGLGHGARFVEVEDGAAVGGVKLAVGEESPVLRASLRAE